MRRKVEQMAEGNYTKHIYKPAGTIKNPHRGRTGHVFHSNIAGTKVVGHQCKISKII